MAGTRLLVQACFALEITLITVFALLYSWEEIIPAQESVTCMSSQSIRHDGITMSRVNAAMTVWRDKEIEFESAERFSMALHSAVSTYWKDRLNVETSLVDLPEELIGYYGVNSFSRHYGGILHHTLMEYPINQAYDMEIIVLIVSRERSDASIVLDDNNPTAMHRNRRGMMYVEADANGNVSLNEGHLSLIFNQIEKLQEAMKLSEVMSVSYQECEDSKFQKFLEIEHYLAILSPMILPLVLPIIFGVKREVIRYRSKSKGVV